MSSLIWCFSRLPAEEPLARHTTLAAQVAPWIFLTTAFIFDFQALDLVSRYGGEELPLLYRISAVWGGRAGPLLLWAAIMGTVTWFMSGRSVSNSVEIRLMHGCTAAIIVISWILSPFADSTGWRGTLNPFLQTDLMVIHPPVVFAYYSLCLAVASIALAGLIKGTMQGKFTKLNYTGHVLDSNRNHRNWIRWIVGIYSTRLGWILGLGSSRDRFYSALVRAIDDCPCPCANRF